MQKPDSVITPEFIEKGNGLSVNSLGLGVFDGLHRGHFEIAKLCDALFTFYPHPDFVLGRIKSSTYITTLDELKRLFSNLIILNFTHYIASLQAKIFLDNVVMGCFSPKKIVVGYDYRFGHNGQGDTVYLKKWGMENNVEVVVIEPVSYKGQLVKSGVIRRFIQNGAFDQAVDFLGHPYLICGKVIYGKGLGRKIGFPTANIETSAEKLLPKQGVYKGAVVIDGNEYKAVTHIGAKPTFGDESVSVEVHIPGFCDDIYGKVVEVRLISKIRDVYPFPNAEALIEQINRDLEVLHGN